MSNMATLIVINYSYQKISDLTVWSVSNRVALNIINAKVRNASELRIDLKKKLLPLWINISMI